jgi:hypothetical protein
MGTTQGVRPPPPVPLNPLGRVIDEERSPAPYAASCCRRGACRPLNRLLVLRSRCQVLSP